MKGKTGEAKFGDPFGLHYVFEKEGSGDLLMLVHPLHVRLFPGDGANKVTIFNELKYQNIDGELVGVVSDSWVLKSDPIPVTWHSIKGPNTESYPEIVAALQKDIAALKMTPILTPSSYFYGKLVARAARLALIAEETNRVDLIPTVAEFLKFSFQPWLDGTLNANGFLYESKWGGLVTKQGSVDAGADFGFSRSPMQLVRIKSLIRLGDQTLAKTDHCFVSPPNHYPNLKIVITNLSFGQSNLPK